MRGLFIFIVGLVLPFAAVAQNFTISGTVKDKTRISRKSMCLSIDLCKSEQKVFNI